MSNENLAKVAPRTQVIAMLLLPNIWTTANG